MSNDKGFDHPIDSWFWVAVTKYLSKLITDEDSDYPPEFLKAMEKYADKKFIFQTEFWTGLQKWKEYIKAHPEFLPDVPALRFWPDERKEAEDFQNLILGAVFNADKDNADKELLQLLVEIATLSSAPQPDMNGVRAAIAAFCNLFKGAHSDDPSNDWPLKGEIRKEAEAILKNDGLPIPGDREWPRIFRKAGLSMLRSGVRQPKRPSTT